MSPSVLFEPYRKTGGDTGVLRYALDDGAIHVQFRDGTVYVYDDAATGREHVAAMQRLAVRGAGLSTYISQHVHHRYGRKYRIS
jgi:hypothetical protein